MRKIETKKLAAAVTALALCVGVLTGCGGAASSTASSTAASSASSEASSEEADEMAAKNVADLIDAIYVQERNEDTDAQCEAAKAAWDALTDTQKELVEGENADPDYFGRDTGDASKDDARNQDDIGDNELLVVSFGTSFNDSRVKDIKGIEDALQAAYPDWSVRRAFTAQIIINHVQARDGEKIDNMQQAMDRAVENGVKNLVVQPTHLMHGAEYDEMMEMIDTYRDKFESVAVAEPLLGEVGSDATIINQDKEDVAKAVTAAAVKEAGYDSLDAIVSALPFFSTKTFSADTSVTLVFKKNSTPFFLYSDRSIAEVSLSIFPNISGSISITFTFTPILLKNEANSIPITPPPIIANDFGKSLRSRASREVQYLTSDNPLIGGITVSEPVHTNTFFTKYSFPSQ